ncbi:MAG: hypothetical protein ACK5HL_02285 [Bacilli bacterium]
MENNNIRNEKIVPHDSVDVKSFNLYKESLDEFTRIEDGEAKIQSFKLYKEQDRR